MTIDSAKEIPISLLVERLGGEFHKRTKPHETWWYSPFRDEKSPSFKVNEKTNKYKDWGDTRGLGDILDLLCDYNNWNRKDKEAIKDALKFPENMGSIQQKFIASKDETVTKYSERYRIKKESKRIKAQGLVDEVMKRNLPLKEVSGRLKEVLVEDTEKKFNGKNVLFNAFAMENDLGGTEICAYYPKKEKPFDKFKNCIGPKGLTTYGPDPTAKEVSAYVYSSMWDAVTYFSLFEQQPTEEHIIYHGDSLVNACAEYILKNPKITKVYHFKHMDAGGQRADAALIHDLEAAPIIYGTMEQLYSGYKDLSERFIEEPQKIRAALKVDRVQSAWHEPLIKAPGQPKYKI